MVEEGHLDVQAFVVRVTIPKSLDGLREQVQEHRRSTGDLFGMTDVTTLATADSVHWSVPRHVMTDDVILFQVSANARRRARKLRPELDALPEDDPDYVGLHFGLQGAENFAGCVVSIGRVAGPAYFGDAGAHYTARHYAEIVDLEPVQLEVIGREPYSVWPEFAAHGHVGYRQFTSDKRYKEFLSAFDQFVDDPLPDWVTREPITVFDNIKVSRDTWMGLAQRSEFGFALEVAVHHYYADWLLRDLSDRRILYSEVRTRTEDEPDHWVDNVILIDGVPVPVEVKVNAAATPHLFDQLNTYRTADSLITKKKVLPERDHDVVLVLDQEGLYITDATTTELPPAALPRRDTTPEAISSLKDEIATRLRS